MIPSPRLRLLTITFLCATLVSTAARAQPAAHRPHSNNSHLSQALQTSLDAQHQALQSQDAVAIADTTRKLASLALQQLATICLLEQDSTQAIELLKRSLELQDLPDVRIDLATALLHAGQTQEASIQIDRVLRADPDNDAALRIKSTMQKTTDANAGKRENTTNHRQQTLTTQQAEQVKLRKPQLQEILATAFNDLGTAEARQHRYTNALADFQEAEHWGPPTADLLHNLGIAAFRAGDFNESVRTLTLYLQQQPTDQRSRLTLAMSQFSTGSFSHAAESFNLASDLATQDPRSSYSWAFSLAHSGHQQQANSIADRLTAQALPADVLNLVCHLYMDTENYEQSIPCFRKALQQDPALKQAHASIGESLIRLDRPADAIPELQQEIPLSPDDPNVQFSLAFALLQMSRKEEAMTMLQNITTTYPNHAPAQYQLGKLLLDQGKPADAVTHLEMSEKNDASPDYVHYQLQVAYRKLGRTPEADRELGLYKEIKSRRREITPTDSVQKH